MFVVVNGACMPAFFPLRAWTLPLRYDYLSTKRGYGGEDPYGSCEISKPTSVVYSTPFRRSVSNYPFRSIHQFRLSHVDRKKIHIFFVRNHFLSHSLSYLCLFSLSLKRFSGIITLQKPSKSLLALLFA